MFSTNFTQPKHGAVVHLTKKEVKKLAKQWGTGLQQTGKVNQINFALKMSKTFT